MSIQLIWRQTAFAMLIFCLVALIYQLETPLTQRFESYISFALAGESSWNMDLQDFQMLLPFSQLNLQVDTTQWKEDLFATLQAKVDRLSALLHQGVDRLLERLRGGTDGHL